ncbi:hypothetical protein ACFXA4_16460 [Streptomyces sp. NPDC059442]|uniref:hypothetical protein n=1 Tax=Streptomyces sp. NPDC059442 TaxID=3346830 RepID=UPI0036C4692E
MVTVSPGADGKSTPFLGGLINISDDDMSRLHKVGFAQEFDMRGSSSTFNHDMNSDTPPTVNPSDPGRDGGRGDVSRGDEENRWTCRTGPLDAC